MKKVETKDRIKEAMKIRGIKQAELVEKTGIDKGQLSSYLSGKYKPRQRNLNLIAQVLSVDEAWLMGYDVPLEGCIYGNPSINFPKIMQYYEQLNDTGKSEAEKRVEELTHLPKYVSRKEDYMEIRAAHNDADMNDVEIEKMNRDMELMKKCKK